MKYKLKSGRIVEKGDYVNVRLTDKTIDFFKSMGLLEEVPRTHTDVYMEMIYLKYLMHLNRRYGNA